MIALSTPVPASFGIPEGTPRPTIRAKAEGGGVMALSTPVPVSFGIRQAIRRPTTRPIRRAAG
jgi:hypothetical protein